MRRCGTIALVTIGTIVSVTLIYSCGGDKVSNAFPPPTYLTSITIDEPTSDSSYETYKFDVTLSGTYSTETYTADVDCVNHTTGEYGVCIPYNPASTWSGTVPVILGENQIEVTVEGRYNDIASSTSINITHPYYHEPFIIDFSGYGIIAHDAIFQTDIETGGYSNNLNIYYGANPSLLQSRITFDVSDSPHLQSFAATVSGFTKGSTYYYQNTLSGGAGGSYSSSIKSFDMIVAPSIFALSCSVDGFTATINPNGYSTHVIGEARYSFFGVSTGSPLDFFLGFGSGESPVTLSGVYRDLSIGSSYEYFRFVQFIARNEGGSRQRNCYLD